MQLVESASLVCNALAAQWFPIPQITRLVGLLGKTFTVSL
jgi:hypothetical protein